jgi:hypothetical protein
VFGGKDVDVVEGSLAVTKKASPPLGGNDQVGMRPGLNKQQRDGDAEVC